MKLTLRKKVVTPAGFQIPATLELVHVVDQRYAKHDDPGFLRTDRVATLCNRTVQTSFNAGKDVLMEVVDGVWSEIECSLCLRAASLPVKS